MSNPPEHSAAPATVSAEMEILLRRVERERRARKQAEQLLENKSMELYEANQRLQAHAAGLERVVHERRSRRWRWSKNPCARRASSSP